MSKPAVEAHGLRKAFGEVQALDGLSLAVPAGCVLGLLGPNGPGKTTTVSILATSLRPDAGRATVGGLDVAAGRLVRGYSGGMRRRLDVAAALLHRPAVLFLDEPTTGLDPESRLALWGSVRDLARSGSTVLLTTQYLEEADALADQVVIISAGRVADTGTPGELKARFGTVLFHLDFGRQEAAQAAHTALASAGYRPQRDGAA